MSWWWALISQMVFLLQNLKLKIHQRKKHCIPDSTGRDKDVFAGRCYWTWTRESDLDYFERSFENCTDYLLVVSLEMFWRKSAARHQFPASSGHWHKAASRISGSLVVERMCTSTVNDSAWARRAWMSLDDPGLFAGNFRQIARFQVCFDGKLDLCFGGEQS